MRSTVTRRKMRHALIIGTISFVAVALAGCGSGEAGTGTSIDVAYSKDEKSIPVGTGVPRTVPTLDQLYPGSEQQPPQSGPAAASGKFVVYVSCGQLSQECAGPGAGAAEAAKVLGWRFAVTDAKFNVAGGFSSAIRQAVTEKPDAIIVYGFDCNLGQQAIAEARAAHIVVEGLLVRDCGQGADALFSANPIYTMSTPTNDSYWGNLGAQQAAYAIDATHGHAKIILVNETDSVPAQVPGTVEMLKKCPGCSVVDTINATAEEYSPGSPLINAITIAMKQHPDANALILPVDTALVTTGLAEALRNNPGTRNLTIIASGGNPAGFTLLKEPDSPYKAGLFWDMAWQGWAGMDALNRAFQNQPQMPEGVGVRLLTADKATSAASNGYQSPIDFRAAYTSVWRPSR